MNDPQMNFLEDASRLLNRQVGRQLELCRELLGRDGSAELRELNSSVQAVARQLEQMTDFARELRQAATGTQGEFSFVALVMLAQNLVEAGAQARDLELEVQVHPSLEGPWVGDSAAFRQILVNSLSLAVQSSQGTTLGVSLTTSRAAGEELVARLVVNGATLDEKSLAVLALRHSVEKLGGRVFTAGSVYAVSLPLVRPAGYSPALDVATVAVAAGSLAGGGAAVAGGSGAGALAGGSLAGALAGGSGPAEAGALAGGTGLDRARRMLRRLARERSWAALEQAASELHAAAPDCLQTLQYLSLARVQQGGDAFPILRQLAVRYFESDHAEAGRALVLQMLGSLPDTAAGLLVAEDCLALGEFGLAETFFREVADRHFAVGALRSGLEVLQRLQVLKPCDVGLGNAIGGMLVRLGDYRQAVKAYRGVLREQPDCQPALEGLSLAAELAGDEELTALAQRRLRSVAVA